MNIKLHKSFAVHPGPWLRRNIVEPYKLTQAEAAKALGVTRVALSNVLNGKAALSPEMAIRFEKGFGVKAATILRMQAAYDLAQATEKAKSIKVRRIPEPA